MSVGDSIGRALSAISLIFLIPFILLLLYLLAFADSPTTSDLIQLIPNLVIPWWVSLPAPLIVLLILIAGAAGAEDAL